MIERNRYNVFHLTLLSFLACFLFASVSAQAAQGSSIFSSKAQLTALDSYSSIPISDFIDIPGLTDKLSSGVQGGWVSEFVQDDLVATGYENFYNYDDVFPGVMLYDVTNDKLEETDRVSVPLNAGLASAGVSANAARPLTAMSIYESVGIPGVAFLPHKFTVRIDHFDVDTGLFDDEAALEFDLSQIDPEFYNASIAYNGVGGFSKDGKYLFLTYGIGVPAPPGFPLSQILTGNRYAMAELSADGSSLTVLAIIDSPPSGKPGLQSFAQKAIMTPMKSDPSVYNVLVPTNSWNLQAPLGSNSQMCYYTFDTNTNDFDSHGCVWAPHYIQGAGFDTENNFFWGITNGVSDDGVSADQIIRPPYDNAAVDKGFNLRNHQIDENTRTITYIGGVDTHTDGIQVQPSRDGKTLFTVTAPAISNDLFSTISNPVSPIGRRYAPNYGSTYSVQGSGVIHLEDTVSLSPLTFGVGFNSDDTRVATSGQDTFESLGGRFTGQKGNQLFKVAKSNQS